MTAGELIEAGPLSLRVGADGDAITITALGELDAARVGVLDHELRKAEASSVRQIILDLSGLEFIDSGGLKLLVIAGRRSQADSNRFAVAPGTGKVAKMLRLTGIDGVLTLI
jgi:stage II sporulation protein AA (anti-sigma F factor antagonist)